MDTLGILLADMLEAGDFSDLTLSCNGHEFKVHKAVVCAQSPVIKAAVKGGFQEARTSVYAVDEFDPTTVRALVQFMYRRDYSVDDGGSAKGDDIGSAKDDGVGRDNDDGVGSANGGDDDDTPSVGAGASETPAPADRAEVLLRHVRVNAIGDYFGIDKLVTCANEKIKSALDSWAEAETKGMDKLPLATSLPCIIQFAAKHTGDNKVIEMLASAAAGDLGAFLAVGAFEELEPVPGFATMVLRRCHEDLEKLRGDFAGAESRWVKGTAAWLNEKEQLLYEKSQLTQAIEALNQWDQCRHCTKTFGGFIDLGEKLFRCGTCRCRHYPVQPSLLPVARCQ